MKSRTRLSDFTLTFHFHALEKEMATHSSVLAWRIPGTGEPGGLPSMGSHRVRHDWCDLAAAAAALFFLLGDFIFVHCSKVHIQCVDSQILTSALILRCRSVHPSCLSILEAQSYQMTSMYRFKLCSGNWFPLTIHNICKTALPFSQPPNLETWKWS